MKIPVNFKFAAVSGFFLRLKPAALRLLPVLTALLLIFSYPRFDQGWLAWFALAPLAVWVLRAKTCRSAAAGGYAAGFIFYLGILYWIYPTMRAGGVDQSVSFFGLLLLAAVMALEFALVCWFGHCVKKAGAGAFPVIFASAWTVMEWGKVMVNLKLAWFPWFTLAYTQWSHTAIIQVVSVTGIYGLSWAIAFTGALTGAAICRRERPLAAALGLLPGVLLVAGLWGYGRMELARAVPGPVELNAALLQPSINLYDKWDEAKAASIQAELAELVRASDGKDFIVWPENALPGWIEEPRYGNWLADLARESGAYHLVGSVSRGDGRRVAAFLVGPDGAQQAEYHKRVLVPFGEYVPMRELLGKFIEPVAALGEFVPGNLAQPLMEFRGLHVAPTICYESIFPFLYRGDAQRGADLFVNITNDGWYLDTAAPRQHLLVNVFRAVETRRPVLRAANNGISAYIDPYGRIQKLLPLNDVGVLAARVNVNPGAPQSFYVRNGDLTVYGCLMLCAAFLLALLFL